jgi:predicted RNase H-like nuclease (RuvC/YqgF family)
VPAATNEQLVARLRATQADLIAQLKALQEEGGFDLTPLPTLAARNDDSSSDVVDDGLSRLKASEKESENEQLRAQIGALEEQLAAFGADPGDVKLLRLQVKELEGYQGQLEAERSQLKRRAAYAEEQLKEVQRYLDSTLGKYQREILKLRQELQTHQR